MIRMSLLRTLLIFIIVSCNVKSNIKDTNERNKYYFKKEDFIIKDSRYVNDFNSCYVVINKYDKKHFVIYADNFEKNKKGEYLIYDIIPITNLNNNQFIQIGSFEGKNKEHQLIVAIEQYDLSEIPDSSIKIYNAWLFDGKRKKFIKKNIKKLYRIHESFYLKE